ncbi:hypothetical protein RND71_015884 [Anisodus tanguticus]|uniref:CCHC-type domain-containing protein n=1 Tax=Anisodus tanguticus TaxID=243964 RepID=A0AAE1VI48_9SOLA|nr:hypothetical protein RND71_015884 [Anisodus tanguticus]
MSDLLFNQVLSQGLLDYHAGTNLVCRSVENYTCDTQYTLTEQIKQLWNRFSAKVQMDPTISDTPATFGLRFKWLSVYKIDRHVKVALSVYDDQAHKLPLIDTWQEKICEKKSQKSEKGYIPKKRTTKTTTCYACGEVGHYANRCKKKKIDKIQALKIDDNIKDALMKIIIPSDESDDSEDIMSTDSEDLYSSSSEERIPCVCTSKKCQEIKDDNTDDEFYKLQAQFSSFNISIINGEEINDLLKEIPEDAQKAKILEALLKAQERDMTPRKIKSRIDPPYNFSEILSELQKKMSGYNPWTTQQLKEETHDLKLEITHLHKHCGSLENRVTLLEQISYEEKGPEISEQLGHTPIIEQPSTSSEPVNGDLMGAINMISRQRWITHVNLLIEGGTIFKDVPTLIDSGADVN